MGRRLRRGRIDRAKKVAFVMAALFPDRLSIDAAGLIASRIEEIDNAVIASIRRRNGAVRLERHDVNAVLNEHSRRR